MVESRAGELADKVNMQIRLAADRVLQAITLKRQAQVAVAASTTLAVVSAARPDLVPSDLAAITKILQVSAIRDWLKETAEQGEQDDDALAAAAEQRLPLDEIDQLLTGQHDLLRALTRQYSWQQQMLRLQEEDAATGARLLAAFAETTGDLAAIRDGLAAVATAGQVEAMMALIRDEVLPRLSEVTRKSYNLSGNFPGAMVNINSQVTIAWPAGAPYSPPAYPAPGELPAPGPLPPGSHLPLPRNPLFTGRGEDLLALAALLLPAAADDGDGRANRPVVIASGIGGVGKTQLAVEFAYRYGRFFHGVHWVSAANPDALDAAIADCGRRMGLHPTFGNLSLPDQVALTENDWAKPAARLVIFDNCEEPRALARRPAGGGARLLVTSRSDRWDVELGAAVRPVRPLPPPESVRLLRRHLTEGEGRPARTDIADDDLGRIAAALGELPLALRLAGAYLRRYKREDAADYLAALGRADVLEHDFLHQEGESDATGHSLSIRNTFAVSFDKLRPDNPTDAAARTLLAVAACFAPGEPLPEALLLAAGERATANGGEPPPARRLDDGLERLLELGLLEGAGADALRLHRLLARFAATALAEEMPAARAAVVEVVRAALRQANNKGDPRSLRGVEAHLRYVVDQVKEQETEAAANLCGSLDYYLGMSGDLRGALPYSRSALEIRERVLGPEHPDTAGSVNNLAGLLQDQGDLAGARPLLERALAIRERVLGPEHPDTAGSVNNLGFLLQAQGDLAGARPLLERALAISELVLGPEHPDTAQSVNNLGYLLRAQGDLVGARPLLERALAIRERVLGPEHPDTAISYVNVGALLAALGEKERARALLERAAAVFLARLGPEHPYTRIARGHLAGLR